MSWAIHAAFRAPQDLFLNGCVPPSTRRAPRAYAAAGFPTPLPASPACSRCGRGPIPRKPVRRSRRSSAAIDRTGWDNLKLLAQIRHRFAFQQMQPENFHFLFATEVAPFTLTHNTVPFYGQQCVSSILKPAFSAEPQQFSLDIGLEMKTPSRSYCSKLFSVTRTA